MPQVELDCEANATQVVPLQQPFGQLALVQTHCPLLQTWPVLQVPQLSVPPQLSEIVPQFLPWAAQVVGLQQVPFRQVEPEGQGQVLFGGTVQPGAGGQVHFSPF